MRVFAIDGLGMVKAQRALDTLKEIVLNESSLDGTLEKSAYRAILTIREHPEEEIKELWMDMENIKIDRKLVEKF